MLKLPRLPALQAIVDNGGKATIIFSQFWQQVVQMIEASVNGIQAALDAAGIAQAAADAANAAAATATQATAAQKSENSLINSFVKNPDNPVSADNTGAITVATHQRQYGDPTLDPTVSVTGATFASGAAAGSVVRVYYDQSSRAGGAVTYAFTVDPSAPPVQGGIRHSVGAVTIPATGTQTGGGVRPPGYATPEP